MGEASSGLQAHPSGKRFPCHAVSLLEMLAHQTGRIRRGSGLIIQTGEALVESLMIF